MIFNEEKKKCECPLGRFWTGEKCIACFLPKYFDLDAKECKVCPKGQYFNVDDKICENV